MAFSNQIKLHRSIGRWNFGKNGSLTYGGNLKPTFHLCDFCHKQIEPMPIAIRTGEKQYGPDGTEDCYELIELCHKCLAGVVSMTSELPLVDATIYKWWLKHRKPEPRDCD